MIVKIPVPTPTGFIEVSISNNLIIDFTFNPPEVRYSGTSLNGSSKISVQSIKALADVKVYPLDGVPFMVTLNGVVEESGLGKDYQIVNKNLIFEPSFEMSNGTILAFYIT